MNKLGIIAGLLCLSFSLIYDWHIAVILILFFVAIKSDTVILIDQKIELLVKLITNSNNY